MSAPGSSPGVDGPALQPEARRALGLGREHPRVLAHRAGGRRDAPAAAVRRHAREPAGHDDVRRSARDRERAQHAAAQLDAVAGQRRRALGRRGRLADPAGRPGLDAGAERPPARRRTPPSRTRTRCRGSATWAAARARTGARGRTRAPPGRRTTSSRTAGRRSGPAEQMAGDGLLERRERRVLQHAGAERVDHRHRSRTRRLHEAGHAELGLRVELERVAVRVVDPAQDHVDRLALAERPHPHRAAADGQIGALDERIARAWRPGRRARTRSRCTGPG